MRCGVWEKSVVAPTVLSGLILLMGVGGAGCCFQKKASFSGRTMGTVYHIVVVTDIFTNTGRLQQAVDDRLAAINNSMSTYIPTSEISRFNTIFEAGKGFDASRDFLTVLKTGKEIHALTNGAWDCTIWPLVKLWGFNHKEIQQTVPDRAAIETALACVDFAGITIKKGQVFKQSPCIVLDLASIAKGYGVDQVADLLKQKGITDFIVEIGGEVYASGCKKNGDQWRVGVNVPEASAEINAVRQTVAVSNKAVATSGDYRNFFVADGKTYSHLLNPATGYPVDNNVVSATVIAGSCVMADGLATALMVMGPADGVPLVNSLENMECLMTVRQADGNYLDYKSAGFEGYLDNH
ncbi:MAG: FAD:protein FMN transferase [Thermodesulfobacteriota bacterium]|nr:FAD:protein FMN transferase [Thermodesulfobacteriota bacterium]